MPLPCIPKKWRIWLQNLVLLSSNCGTKWLLQEIISPGKKMSTQRYIGNDEVRNLRIISSPKIHGLFHSSTDGIFHFLQWSVTTLTPWFVYTEVLCASLSRYNHKPNERFYRRQFAFIVITHWCEHRLKITNVVLIRIFYSRHRYKSSFQIIFTGITEHFRAVCYRSTTKCFESFIYYTQLKYITLLKVS